MVDDKEKGTDSGDGQVRLLDAGEKGRPSSRESANSETTQRNSEEGGGETMGKGNEVTKNGTNGKNGARKELDEIRELLRMASLQTAENARQLAKYAKEHDREMKEIRVLFKKMIQRIAI